jgi:hypothetical protein
MEGNLDKPNLIKLSTPSEKVGITPEAVEESKEFVHGITNALAKELGLDIPKDRLPDVKLFRLTNPLEMVGYETVHNTIELHTGMSVLKTPLKYYGGNAFGEEISHFFRSYFTNTIGNRAGYDDVNYMTAQEFYGYIGRKVLLRMTEKMGNSDVLFDEKGVWPPHNRAVTLEKINERAKDRQKMAWWAKGLFRKLQHYDRVQTIAHDRGYGWADKVDVERIKDWKKFYSLPTDEVRKRFFRPEPDYSGLSGEVAFAEA